MKKTTTILKPLAVSVALCSVAVAPAAAATSSDQSSQPSRETIKLHRANGLMGLDVISSDGKKVGDIVDLAFRLQGAPGTVTHALVMSGGFFDRGGDVRAVPTGALTLKQDSARLDASAQEFDTAAIIPQDRRSFFADSSRVAQVDEHFQAQTSAAKQQFNHDSSASGQSADRQADYVLYSILHREDVVGNDGDKLGYITDVWTSLENEGALLIEMNPATENSFPFQVRSSLRYELPASMYRGMAEEDSGYRFAVSESQLSEAPHANAIDNITMEVGVTDRDTVMRLKPATQKNM